MMMKKKKKLSLRALRDQASFIALPCESAYFRWTFSICCDHGIDKEKDPPPFRNPSYRDLINHSIYNKAPVNENFKNSQHQ